MDEQQVEKTHIWVGPAGVVLGGSEKPDGLYVCLGVTYKGWAPQALELARVYRKLFSKAVNDAVTTSVTSGWSSVDVDAQMLAGSTLICARGVHIDHLEHVLWQNAKPGLVRFDVSEESES